MSRYLDLLWHYYPVESKQDAAGQLLSSVSTRQSTTVHDRSRVWELLPEAPDILPVTELQMILRSLREDFQADSEEYRGVTDLFRVLTRCVHGGCHAWLRPEAVAGHMARLHARAAESFLAAP